MYCCLNHQFVPFDSCAAYHCMNISHCLSSLLYTSTCLRSRHVINKVAIQFSHNFVHRHVFSFSVGKYLEILLATGLLQI